MTASFTGPATVSGWAELVDMPAELLLPIHFALQRQKPVDFDAGLLAARLCECDFTVCWTGANAEVCLSNKRVVVAWANTVRWILILKVGHFARLMKLPCQMMSPASWPVLDELTQCQRCFLRAGQRLKLRRVNSRISFLSCFFNCFEYLEGWCATSSLVARL